MSMVVAVCGCGAPSAPRPRDAESIDAARLSAFFTKQLAARAIPGLQVAIVRHRRIVYSEAFGVADPTTKQPLLKTSALPINSLTKGFTSVAIMQLVEAGRIDLDAPVSRYLESLPTAWRPVTIRQLLSHSSGLPDLLNPQTGELIRPEPEAAWTAVQTVPMEFAPGARFRYNQLGYVLLGKVIDKLAGQPFQQFVTDGQLRKVSMPQTGYDTSSAPSFAAEESTPGSIVYTKVSEPFPRMLMTAAGMASSAEDLAHWIIAIEDGTLLARPQSVQTMWTDDASPGGLGGQFDAYALGWHTMTRPEHRAVGNVGGGRAVIMIYPQDDLAIVLLTNRRPSNPESFVEQAVGLLLPALADGLSPAVNSIRAQVEANGYADPLAVVRERQQKNPAFQLTEGEINAWAYHLLGTEKTKQAIAVFKMNVTLSPNSANAYDSLGEAYMAAGDNAAAIANYRRSLELDPTNQNAVAQLGRLTAP